MGSKTSMWQLEPIKLSQLTIIIADIENIVLPSLCP